MLSGLRVLDLTDEKGQLCGKMLADLGADVIKIEPPAGDPSRSLGPFYHDIPCPERSLFWFAYNSSKRSITLNLEATEGRDIFKQLVSTADVVIESFSPGYLASLGLDYQPLKEINPRLIMSSITAFGQDGPYKYYEAPDIVGMAMGGIMSLTGDPDRPPVRISFPQAYLHAAAQAAVGILMAYYRRDTSGEGQWIDVSMQEAVLWTMINTRSFWELNKMNVQRHGPFRAGLSSGAVCRQNWPCKDGEITFIVLGAGSGARTNRALVQWMDEEGMSDDFLKTVDWEAFDMATATQEFHNRIEEPIGRFFLSHTKFELYEQAVKRGVMLCPVASAKDIAQDPQLQARGYWAEVEHPELEAAITYPGAFIKSSIIPCRKPQRPPRVGEHNEEIYQGELGFSREQQNTLKQGGVI